MVDIYFLFNRKTEANIGFSLDPKSVTGDVLWRKVQVPSTENLFNIKWEGTYSKGKFVRISDTNAIVTEYDLEEKFFDRLFRKYGAEQIFYLILGKNTEWDDTEDQEQFNVEYDKMLTFFKKNYLKLKKEKEHFKNSPDHEFQTKEEISENISRQFAV